jgi:formaldehyde-activating enzyme involved in methanogenesis
MLSTATALIEATEQSIFDDEVMSFATMINHTHAEMEGEQFAKAIYMYSCMLASLAVDKTMKVLLNKEQIKELLASIDELETIGNEVLKNGK